MYAAAVVIWAIFAGLPPHAGLSEAAAAEAAADPARRLRPPAAALRPPGLAALLEEAWSHEPARRPPAEEMLGRIDAQAGDGLDAARSLVQLSRGRGL